LKSRCFYSGFFFIFILSQSKNGATQKNCP
jgi:hypothetical protein